MSELDYDIQDLEQRLHMAKKRKSESIDAQVQTLLLKRMAERNLSLLLKGEIGNSISIVHCSVDKEWESSIDSRLQVAILREPVLEFYFQSLANGAAAKSFCYTVFLSNCGGDHVSLSSLAEDSADIKQRTLEKTAKLVESQFKKGSHDMTSAEQFCAVSPFSEKLTAAILNRGQKAADTAMHVLRDFMYSVAIEYTMSCYDTTEDDDFDCTQPAARKAFDRFLKNVFSVEGK